MEHISEGRQAFFSSLFGQGPGDPDVHGHYPGDEGEASCLMCKPVKYKTPSIYRKKHWSETVKRTYNYEPREFADNDPASPEQAGW